jgi:glutathione S-transferase
MSNKITLYTAHHCPFAHRVQIILRELRLEFETCLVDITVPRTPEYLAINPSGMVPALKHNGLILTESGLICQFLADSYPSHLLLPSSVPGGALQRFRIGHFVETYSSKAHGLFDSTVFSNSAEAKIDMANKYVDAVVKYVEPLLVDSAPFYGGSDRLTLAEVSGRWPMFVVEKQLTTILRSRC